MNARAIVGLNIRRLRSERGWSQEDLADRCGIHRTYVGSVERGERNLGLDNLERIAKVLDVPTAHLLVPPARGGGRR